jgi:hypothetical protein
VGTKQSGPAPIAGVPVTPTSQPISVDFDVSGGGRIYWIQQGQGQSRQIWSATLKNENPMKIFDSTTSGQQASRLAVDGNNKLMFVMAANQAVLISMATDGSNQKIIVSNINGGRAVALNTTSRWVMFANTNFIISLEYK